MSRKTVYLSISLKKKWFTSAHSCAIQPFYCVVKVDVTPLRCEYEGARCITNTNNQSQRFRKFVGPTIRPLISNLHLCYSLEDNRSFACFSVVCRLRNFCALLFLLFFFPKCYFSQLTGFCICRKRRPNHLSAYYNTERLFDCVFDDTTFLKLGSGLYSKVTGFINKL